MANASTLSYRVFRDIAGWSWEILVQGSRIDAGVAPTMIEAQVEAMHAVILLANFEDEQRRLNRQRKPHSPFGQ